MVHRLFILISKFNVRVVLPCGRLQIFMWYHQRTNGFVYPLIRVEPRDTACNSNCNRNSARSFFGLGFASRLRRTYSSWSLGGSRDTFTSSLAAKSRGENFGKKCWHSFFTLNYIYIISWSGQKFRNRREDRRRSLLEIDSKKSSLLLHVSLRYFETIRMTG